MSMTITPDALAQLSDRDLYKAFIHLASLARCEHESGTMDMVLDEINIRRAVEGL